MARGTSGLDLSVEIPGNTVENFMAAMSRYQTEVGNEQHNAVRRGTIALIRSLRAVTKTTKRYIPRKAVKKFDGVMPDGKKIPKWHRADDGHAYRRFVLTRLRGKDLVPKVYAADNAREVWRRRGAIYRTRLAKKTWGFFMFKLFQRAAGDGGNPNAKVTRKMVDGHFKVRKGEEPSVDVLLLNHLDYISQALTPQELDEVMQKATNYINGQIDKDIAHAKKEVQ